MSFWSRVGNIVNPLKSIEHTADLVRTAGGIARDVGNEGLGSPVRFYGNWGGPWHGAGQPIDGLDRAFRGHDYGYEKRGFFDHPTDIVFSTRAGLNNLDPNASGRERLYGIVATSIFSAASPLAIGFTTVVNPIKNADNPVEAVVNVVNAPLEATKSAVRGTVRAVGDFLGF